MGLLFYVHPVYNYVDISMSSITICIHRHPLIYGTLQRFWLQRRTSRITEIDKLISNFHVKANNSSEERILLIAILLHGT